MQTHDFDSLNIKARLALLHAALPTQISQTQSPSADLHIATLLSQNQNLTQKFTESEAFRNPATVDNFLSESFSIDQNGTSDPSAVKIDEFIEDIAERMIQK